MKIGVLGTGAVGETIATALLAKGHTVRMGSRTPDNEKARTWVKKSKEQASQGDFNDTAAFGELLFLCLNGAHALDAVRTIEPENVKHKIVFDLTNPLDFSKGMPPSIIDGLGNTNSLGEEIQKALPNAYIIKALNTVTAKLMVEPKLVNNGDHSLFVCGNHADAKNKAKHFLVDTFGWKPDNLIDLGGIESARGSEAYVPFWVSMMQGLGTAMFNVKVVR
jgi:predicted dinucleotide-binding enzyme